MGGRSSLRRKNIFLKLLPKKHSAVLMSFISGTLVAVKTNRNIFLNLFKNQSPTTSLLKNELTLKIATTRSMSSDSKCIFCQIVNKTAEANILHEDEKLLVFTDRSPAADHHYLVITKEHIVDIRSLTREDIPLVKEMEDVGLKVLQA